jgi:hypothetical protein
MTNLDQIVVVSDNHGRPELLYAIDDFYRSSKRLIIDGDILDGKNWFEENPRLHRTPERG